MQNRSKKSNMSLIQIFNRYIKNEIEKAPLKTRMRFLTAAEYKYTVYSIVLHM